MKTTLRVLALTSLAAAFVAGASVPKNNAAMVAAVRHFSVPGPIPLCNPLTQNCPNIREK